MASAWDLTASGSAPANTDTSAISAWDVTAPPTVPIYAGPGNAEHATYIAPQATKPEEAPPQGPGSFLANAGTALARMPATIAAIPNALADVYMGLSGDKSGIAPAVSEYMPTEKQATDLVFKDINAATGQNFKPYQPQTLPGQVFQDVVANTPAAMIGAGGGAKNLATALSANAAGTTAADTAATAFPDRPALQAGSALAAALVGGGIPSAASTAGTVGGRLLGRGGTVENAAAARLLSGAEGSRDDLLSAIAGNMPGWQFEPGELQPQPHLGTVTQDPGIQGMVYRDAAAAEREGNPVYRTNELVTNQAQREAIGRVTPDISGDTTQARSDLAAALSGLPTGVSAQEAGSNFRQGLQNVYDQRLQARRQLGENVFSGLETSPAQIGLRPIMDYATEQAAKNAGVVGDAYKAALGQFRSGTGITLDTAPFANSVLKGLGDLAGQYPQGSAAQRAVLDVKGRAEQAIMDQEPAIGQARTAYAQASKPLDVFDPSVTPGPIANATQQTRFGGYTTPNDAVVGQFLRSNGASDAIDRLNTVFGDVKSATQPLQDYIASQARAAAVNPDGSVNLAKLKAITDSYPVLQKPPFSDLKGQFSTVEGAQTAIDQLTARQNLYENFANGLNASMQVDRGGNFMYSPRRFNDFVQAHDGELGAAYGADGADRIRQINQQLTDMTQNAYVRRAGQSGTSQAMPTQGSVLTNLFAAEGFGESALALVGRLSGGVENVLGGGALGRIAGLGVAQRLRTVDSRIGDVTRQALSDPTFAKALLEKYNPAQPSSAGVRAMQYVRNSLAGGEVPQLTDQRETPSLAAILAGSSQALPAPSGGIQR
jgi:hypothetical protein